MRLEELLEGVSFTGTQTDRTVNEVTCDSRQAGENVLFACLKGEHFDGHDFAQKAAQKGSVVLVQKDMGIPGQILVPDSRYAYAKICANYYGNPANSLTFIGITGTNGKTTVTHIVKNCLKSLKCRVGLIGTIQNEIGDTIRPATKTTPDPLEYQQLLCSMRESGCKYVVMEVSSHALEQKRLGDTSFRIGAFTNLTQDHLDYHGDMESYYQAKKLLFEHCEQAIVCVDDPYGKRLASEISCTTFSAGQEKADVVAQDIEMGVDGVSFTVSYQGEKRRISFGVPGLFSVHNALTALLICLHLHIPFAEAAQAIADCPPVKGRSERIPTGRDFTILCDYAHTPDGLKNILESVRGYKKGRLVALFGCGGDRDREKRPFMGEMAAKYADFLIITSDNPRTENPDAIIDDIIRGVEKYETPYQRITNRKEAIRFAITHAQPDDIIVLAGKGHEDYQVLADGKIHFDEREVVAEILKDTEE